MEEVKLFRATVWTRKDVASDSDLQRRIVTTPARDAGEFEAIIRDRFTWNVDDVVDFGPISEVKKR